MVSPKRGQARDDDMATTTEHRSQLLNVIQQPEVQQLLDEAREKFSTEEGVALSIRSTTSFSGPVEHDFTADQRPHTTLLFGGFTFRHEYLIKCHFERLGYKVERAAHAQHGGVPKGQGVRQQRAVQPDLLHGRQPRAVPRASSRRPEGLSVEEINKNYFFITAGACGPCRFGMYEAEYRLALRNSGFDGFRVLLFQQKGGLKQAEVKAGLELNTDFFMGLVTTINMGDLLNEFANQIRPYETKPGETDRATDGGTALPRRGDQGDRASRRSTGKLRGDSLEDKKPERARDAGHGRQVRRPADDRGLHRAVARRLRGA